MYIFWLEFYGVTNQDFIIMGLLAVIIATIAIWGLNVWHGVFDGHLTGPYFCNGTLTSERYLDFLQNTLSILLQDVPLNES